MKRAETSSRMPSTSNSVASRDTAPVRGLMDSSGPLSKLVAFEDELPWPNAAMGTSASGGQERRGECEPDALRGSHRCPRSHQFAGPSMRKMAPA